MSSPSVGHDLDVAPERPLRRAGELLAFEEHRHELRDGRRVPQVVRQRGQDVLAGERQLAIVVEDLGVVREQVEGAAVRIAVQRQEGRPPPRSEVLCFVHHDRVVARTEEPRRLLEQAGQQLLEVGAFASDRGVRDGQTGLPCELGAQLMEMRHIQVLHVLGGGTQVLAQAPVEACQQGPPARLGETPGDRGREDRLAGSGRPRDERAVAMQDVGAQVRLLLGELDDPLVLLAEEQAQRGADLDRVAERALQREHPALPETPALVAPHRHHLGDALGETIGVVSIDHEVGGRAGMGVAVVDPVRERARIAIGRTPLVPAGLRLQDPCQRVHLVLGLVERVLVELVPSPSSALRPAAPAWVVAELTALGLHHEHAVLWVSDHEVGLSLIRPVAATRQHPVDRVEDDVAVIELGEEPLVEDPLGRALGREHRERHHASHERDANGAGGPRERGEGG